VKLLKVRVVYLAGTTPGSMTEQPLVMVTESGKRLTDAVGARNALGGTWQLEP
jgi:hypothetical protein